MAGLVSCVYQFGPFRLDRAERRLLREKFAIPLRAKVFDTLCVLVEHHGRLIEKDALIQQIWPDAVVEEGNLAHNISVLRKTLGEQATGEKYIETIPGRGYRFVAEVTEIHRREALPQLTPEKPFNAPVVQRQNELQHLHQSLGKALAGTRQVVFVTGEAGIGKTTLVDAFSTQAREKTRLWFGSGQCLEHRGQGEPYMPVLEALARICRGTSGQELVPFLSRFAPAWLVQMPWLLADAELAALQQKVLGATRERMLREMVEAVETLTAGKPLLLVLEDLHWSDYSTLDLVACLARRKEPAPLLLIGTYRPGDVRMLGHPLRDVVQDLKARGLCDHVSLASLDENAIAEYLAVRFPGAAGPAGLARVLHQRTEGNPLFMTTVVDDWASRGLLDKPLEELSRAAPDTLRQLIQRQLEMANLEDRAILEAASVAGREFSTAAAAGALEQSHEAVEARCDTLAGQGHFLRFCGASDWPDGTIAGRYAFTHDLHREILYEGIPPVRKARLHRQIGARLESGYGSHAREIAAELAVHFVEGRDAVRAARYLQYTAEQALARSAHREAIEHLTAALQIVQTMPESAARSQQEIDLHAILAPALIMTRGWGNPEAKESYLRATELCQRLEAPPHHSLVLLGLATLLEVRGDYRRSQTLIEESLRLSPCGRPAELHVESHELLACSLFHQGDFAQALEHAKQGLRLYDPRRLYAFLASYGDNPAVGCHNWSALSLWFLGYPDQALQKVTEALTVARDHPYSLAGALTQAAIVHQFRREPDRAHVLAEAAVSVATDQGFPYRVAVGTILRGWAAAMQGECAEGIVQLRKGLADCRAAGAEMDHPYYLALLAEAYTAAGQPEDALCTLAEALVRVEGARSFFYEAELHRLWGNALMQAGLRCMDDAEASFERAVRVARRQKARCLELRAALSLARVRAERADARQALSGICHEFTEGLDTPDLIAAHAMLGASTRELSPSLSA